MSSTKPSSTSDWEPPSPDDLHRLLPQYEITGILGRGGMGAVYEGRQAKLDRRVAIKVLPENFTKGEDELNFARRFEQEAQTMAGLDHPAIIWVHDFGETSEGQRNRNTPDNRNNNNGFCLPEAGSAVSLRHFVPASAAWRCVVLVSFPGQGSEAIGLQNRHVPRIDAIPFGVEALPGLCPSAGRYGRHKPGSGKNHDRPDLWPSTGYFGPLPWGDALDLVHKWMLSPMIRQKQQGGSVRAKRFEC